MAGWGTATAPAASCPRRPRRPQSPQSPRRPRRPQRPHPLSRWGYAAPRPLRFSWAAGRGRRFRCSPHRRDFGLAPSSCRLPLKGGVMLAPSSCRLPLKGGVMGKKRILAVLTRAGTATAPPAHPRQGYRSPLPTPSGLRCSKIGIRPTIFSIRLSQAARVAHRLSLAM